MRTNTGDLAAPVEAFDPLALPLMAALVFVSLVPYPFIKSADIGGVPVLRLLPLAFGLAVALAAFYRYFAHRPGSPGCTVLAGPLLILTGVGLLSSIGSVDPAKSLSKAAFYAVTGIAFFFAAACLNRKSARGLLWVLLTASCLVGAVSASEFFTGRVPLYYQEFVRNNTYYSLAQLAGRSFSTIGHPVFLGAYFVLTIPVGFYLFQTGKKPYTRAFAGICVLSSLLGLFFTFSRGAYIAAALSAFVFYRGRISGRKMAAACILLLAVVICLAALSGKARLLLEQRNPLQGYAADFRSNHRVMAYELTARVMADEPLLGVGVGNYRLLYEKYRIEGDDTRRIFATPDNMYLVTISETGLLGFGLFLYILYRAYASFSAGCRAGGDRDLRLAGLAILSGFAVDLFFFDGLYVEPMRVVFWTLMGIACREAGGGPAPCPAR